MGHDSGSIQPHPLLPFHSDGKMELQFTWLGVHAALRCFRAGWSAHDDCAAESRARAVFVRKPDGGVYAQCVDRSGISIDSRKRKSRDRAASHEEVE